MHQLHRMATPKQVREKTKTVLIFENFTRRMTSSFTEQEQFGEGTHQEIGAPGNLD
ncbi:hypothetical protein KIN20_036430 [Parelaphostrongylus tenuis]|uniref:Uncharacterized protein n=1 Tax=Parelaphostrongylus tenuis TaxID=148309 RepID=A0AAD5WKL8_PARTN|nr:hypothetical protein KIN20_036430 [Parelaphostrongylus tenuis]